MTEKGETSRKISSRVRQESKSSDDTSNMSMKINVKYRGIVYRVRGIKVLCSVITAVILLLVTIVGLGVWMLVSAYGETKTDHYSNFANMTTLPMPQDLEGRGDLGDSSTVFSIDFNAPSMNMDELPVAASIPSSFPNENGEILYNDTAFSNEKGSFKEDIAINEAIGHFQGVTPGYDQLSSSRLPGPDPPFGLFNGVPEFSDSKESITTEYLTSAGSISDWPFISSGEPSDSIVELSQYHPVSVASPPDFKDDYIDETLDGYIRNSNGEIYLETKHPLNQDSHYYSPRLPDDIPRDVDPTLIDSDMPFPFPPSLSSISPIERRPPLRPGRRRNKQRPQRPIFRRIPQGIRRGQANVNAQSPRPVYNQRPLMPEYNSQNMGDYQIYDPYFAQKQGFQPQDNQETQQPSTVREVPTESFLSSFSPDNINRSLLQKFAGNGDQNFPGGVTLPPGFNLPENIDSLKLPGSDSKERRPAIPGRYMEDMMHYYNKHERPNIPTPTSSTGNSQYSERIGISEHKNNSDLNLGHAEISDIQGQNADSVFNHFYNVYNPKNKPPALHDDRGPVPEESSGWNHQMHPHKVPNPNIRGLRPDGQGYPIRIRPDAENPDRILLVGSSRSPNQQHIMRSTTPFPSQHRPFLGPLHDIYQYSQKLATTLLNFPGSLLSQVHDSRVEHMQNEVELLKDYNKVFEQSNITSADVLPDMFNSNKDRDERLMILDTDKIKSMDPFELSLITWTFLDFWEFLIEKVGTLSKADLKQLEARLERLKKQKDHRMAKSLVEITVEHFSKKDPSDRSDGARSITFTEELNTTLSIISSNITDEIEDLGALEMQARMWDPLGIFSSDERMKFMQYSFRVVFNFGRVYFKKKYALDCMMLLFCKDLNSDSKKDGMDGISGKIKSVGLKVLTEREDRQMDTIGEIWRALTAWETLQCEAMFPKCDGPKALEIVNEVALGTRK